MNRGQPGIRDRLNTQMHTGGKAGDLLQSALYPSEGVQHTADEQANISSAKTELENTHTLLSGLRERDERTFEQVKENTRTALVTTGLRMFTEDGTRYKTIVDHPVSRHTEVGSDLRRSMVTALSQIIEAEGKNSRTKTEISEFLAEIPSESHGETRGRRVLRAIAERYGITDELGLSKQEPTGPLDSTPDTREPATADEIFDKVVNHFYIREVTPLDSVLAPTLAYMIGLERRPKERDAALDRVRKLQDRTENVDPTGGTGIRDRLTDIGEKIGGLLGGSRGTKTSSRVPSPPRIRE